MSVLGLNFGKNSFRAIELDKKRDKIIVNNFGSFEDSSLNLDAITKENVDDISKVLQQFVEDTGFNTSRVVVGLNERHVFMRVIKLPNMSDKDLKTSIKYESEQYIPIPIDQVQITYQKLEPDFEDKDKVGVQVVAAKQSVLDMYMDLLKRAKLSPKAIEPETVALGRVLGDQRNSPVGTLILEMGHTSSLIIVSYAGAVRFTRTIPIGGDILTKTLQQGLDLDAVQSEEYKKTYGLDQSQADGKVYDTLKPIIDNLILEVKRAQIFFTNHNPSANIKRVMIAGGTSLMPGMLGYMASNLDLEVELANPLKNLEISPKLETRKQELIAEAPRYSTTVGLALKGLM